MSAPTREKVQAALDGFDRYDIPSAALVGMSARDRRLAIQRHDEIVARYLTTFIAAARAYAVAADLLRAMLDAPGPLRIAPPIPDTVPRTGEQRYGGAQCYGCLEGARTAEEIVHGPQCWRVRAEAVASGGEAP